MPQFPPPLPTNRAFVVQLRAQPPSAPLRWDGRVEHVVSGQMTHFHSLDELLAFIRRVLAGVSDTLKRAGRVTGAAAGRRPCARRDRCGGSRVRKETAMIRRFYLLAFVSVLLHVGMASAQESFPIMEKIAQKVIEKYQTSSCQQLAQQKSQPPTGQQAQMEQRAIQTLRNDPQMRTAFLNRVAAPIANKLFECGMIP